jgi:hypothetical protein
MTLEQEIHNIIAEGVRTQRDAMEMTKGVMELLEGLKCCHIVPKPTNKRGNHTKRA